MNAATWLLLDPSDGRGSSPPTIPSEERAIASTTKLMTAYLALRKLSMNEKLEVPAYSPEPAESVAGLIKGEKLTVHDLLDGDDAAERQRCRRHGRRRGRRLAEGVRRRDEPGRRQARPRPHQLRQPDRPRRPRTTTPRRPTSPTSRSSFSTISRFRKIVAEPEATLKSGSQERLVENTNTLLLSDPSVDGVKTGHTLDAGYVLVASAKRDGVPLIAAVLGAPSEAERDAAAEQLLDYGYSLYDRKTVVEARRGGRDAPTVRYEDEDLPLLAKRAISVAGPRGPGAQGRRRGPGGGRGTDRGRATGSAG